MYSNESQFLLNLYAPNNKRERNNYWSKVGELVQTSNLKKGIIMGDLNTPLMDEEKMGGLVSDWDSNKTSPILLMDWIFWIWILQEEPLHGLRNTQDRSEYRSNWKER